MADFRKWMSQDALPFCLKKLGFEAAATFGTFLRQKYSLPPTNTQPTPQPPTNVCLSDSIPTPLDQLDMLSLERKLDEALPQVMEQDNKLLDQNNQLLDRNNQLLDQNNQMLDRYNQLLDRNKQLLDRNNQLLDQNNQLADQNNQLLDRNNQLLDQNNQLLHQNSKLVSTIAVMGEEIFSLKTMLELKEKEINELTSSNVKLLEERARSDEAIRKAKVFNENAMEQERQRQRFAVTGALNMDGEQVLNTLLASNKITEAELFGMMTSGSKMTKEQLQTILLDKGGSASGGSLNEDKDNEKGST